jgi:hypothetical protein
MFFWGQTSGPSSLIRDSESALGSFGANKACLMKNSRTSRGESMNYSRSFKSQTKFELKNSRQRPGEGDKKTYSKIASKLASQPEPVLIKMVSKDPWPSPPSPLKTNPAKSTAKPPGVPNEPNPPPTPKKQLITPTYFRKVPQQKTPNPKSSHPTKSRSFQV